MKTELSKIAQDLTQDKITEQEARTLLLGLLGVGGRIPLGTKVKTVQGDKTITNNSEEYEGEPAYRCNWNTEELWIAEDFIEVYDR